MHFHLYHFLETRCSWTNYLVDLIIRQLEQEKTLTCISLHDECYWFEFFVSLFIDPLDTTNPPALFSVHKQGFTLHIRKAARHLCLGHNRKGLGRLCRIENLSEFREVAWIWESSLWQSHSNRAPSVHLQDKSRPKSERVVADTAPAGRRPNALPICWISGWHACSMGKFGRGGVTRPDPLYWGWVAREVQNC